MTAPERRPAILATEKLNVRYGTVNAVRDLTFEIARGSILTLIGANGAGKSSVLRAISGLVRPASGRVLHLGTDISRLAPHRIVGRRISHSPEGRGIFLNLSVEENLDLGAWAAPRGSRFEEDLEQSYALFPRLKERRSQNAGTLSGGEQQILAIARALMAHPELLLLDEPSLGLAPQMIETICEIIQKVNRQGTSILLVEQNAYKALQIADEAVVLEGGRAAQCGPAAQLLKSDEIRKAYLGG